MFKGCRIKINTNGCWQWLGPLNRYGYGRYVMTKNGVSFSTTVHRVSYFLFKGYLSPLRLVLHKCNNKRCINPDHLYAGTHFDNSQDMKKHGLHKKRVPRGDGHPCCLIKDKTIKKLREDFESGIGTSELSRKYSISKMYVWALVTYRHRLAKSAIPQSRQGTIYGTK